MSGVASPAVGRALIFCGATLALGVAGQTLRRWEREVKLISDERTPGGRRRYDLSRLRPEQFHAPETARRTVAYARISDLAKDAPEIITAFSVRLYGSRSRKNQKQLDGVRAAVENVQP
ncbi:MerR family DNA-binding transcriptional regulator [Ralstonia pseudosolanacearum]|uniref:MerR family DNA-binding transcriptional regulator n=1 Tax=Ralstonia pseudosolanacearum TaxID=1310165 RepID=UPI003CF4E0AD